MIDPHRGLPIKRQAQLIDILRGTAFYESRQTTSDADQALMEVIDRLHLDYPFAVARVLRDMLHREPYIPMARGWVYLAAAVIDWASRRVLSHRVSISMDTSRSLSDRVPLIGSRAPVQSRGASSQR
jgi:putative transposase